MALLKPCYVDGCGELSDQARCPAHRPRHPTKGRKSRGYPAWWERLSRQARQLQPWCSTCQTPGSADNPLTVDHTPESWQRVQAGKRLTLHDFESGLLTVQCLRHNIALGAARGRNVTR
ncbi:hypothetical protein MINTM002_29030 [Mycobacterium intracellulare]|nr:hypothetical protein MINTM002_29030 [Mycobacterium intracellulare]